MIKRREEINPALRQNQIEIMKVSLKTVWRKTSYSEMLGENTKMVTKEDVKVNLRAITEFKNTMFYIYFISVRCVIQIFGQINIH